MENKKYEWLKPRVLPITFVIILWIIIASIQIVPVTIKVYSNGIELSEMYPAYDVYKVNQYKTTFIDAASLGFERTDVTEFNSNELSLVHEFNMIVCSLIAISWLPLYFIFSWLDAERIKRMSKEE